MFDKKYKNNLLLAGRTGIEILHYSQNFISLSERLKYISYNGSIQAAIIQGVKAYSLKELANSLSEISKKFAPAIEKIEKRCTNFSTLIIRTNLLMEINIKNELSLEIIDKKNQKEELAFLYQRIKDDFEVIQEDIFNFLIESKDDIINFRYIVKSINKDSTTIKYIGSNILIDTANFGKKRSSFISLVEDINKISNDLNLNIDKIDTLINSLNSNIEYLLNNTK